MANIDMKIKDLLKVEGANDVFEKHIPGITSNPKLKLVGGQTFRAVYKMVGVSDDVAEAINTDLEALD